MTRGKTLVLLCLVLAISLSRYGCLGHHYASITQLSATTDSPMMGYIIRTNKDRLIVIDGGTKSDEPHLIEMIKQKGGRVAAWFITHPHFDHAEAIALAKNNPSITIDHIYASLIDVPIAEKYEPQYVQNVIDFNDFIAANQSIYTELALDETIVVDDISIKVLGVKNPEITTNFINNSGCVFKIQNNETSVLFLGDLGVEGGQILLKRYPTELKSDIVQMAHHGQGGIAENIYQAIAPRICLWPTPKWLWNNQLDHKPMYSGPWDTVRVRKWMESLQAASIVSYLGDAEFELKPVDEIIRQLPKVQGLVPRT